MGSLSFPIIINDALVDVPHSWKYFDDYAAPTVIDKTSSDYSPLQDALDDLLALTTDNKVNVHYNKTVFMLFNNATTQVQAPAFQWKTMLPS